MSFRSRAGLGLLITLAWACADRTGVEDVPEVPDAPWTIGESPRIVIGAGVEPVDGSPYFVVIGNVSVAPNGDLFIVDGRLREVLRVAADGRYIKGIGGAGDGPGEFRSLTELWLDSDSGHLIVWDALARRITEFDAEGDLVRVFGISHDLPALSGAGRFEDGSWFVRSEPRTRIAEVGGIARDTIEVFHLSQAGELEGRITRVPGTISTQVSFRGLTGHPTVLFSPHPAVVALGNCLVTSPGNTRELSVVDQSGGVVAQFTLPVEEVPTTDEHRELEVEILVARTETSEERAMAVQIVNQTRMAEVLPVVSRLFVDDLGYIWVRTYDGPHDPSEAFTILDGRGRIIGNLRLPMESAIRAATADALVLSTRGDFDEQIIKVFTLDRGIHGAPAAMLDACTSSGR